MRWSNGGVWACARRTVQRVHRRVRLAAAIAVHGAPHHLRSDNGGEFIARKLQQCLKAVGIAPRVIKPGQPFGKTA